MTRSLVSRRNFLKTAGAIAGTSRVRCTRPFFGQMTAQDAMGTKADYTLKIATTPLELSPNRIVSVTTYNGQTTAKPMFHLREGKRYRIHMKNASDDIHPVHLHRHSFEVTRFEGQPMSGLMKDVVMVNTYQEVEIDFVANNPGLTLFHCHQQLHMDFGFIGLFDYV